MKFQSNLLVEHEEVLNQYREQCLYKIEKISNIIHQKLSSGSCLYVFGNGGSAADADHLCAELVVRFEKERVGYNVKNLASSNTIITAAGNDYGFDNIFSKQLQSLSRPGDIGMAITTSGKSKNILRALEYCSKNNVETIVLTGKGGEYLKDIANYVMAVPSSRTAIIQQFHILSIHLLCEIIDEISQ